MRTGKIDEWQMTDLDFHGSLLHQTWWSLLKAASALPVRDFMAVLEGVVQDICEAKYLAVSVVGTGLPFAKEIVRVSP